MSILIGEVHSSRIGHYFFYTQYDKTDNEYKLRGGVGAVKKLSLLISEQIERSRVNIILK